jgi:hypothetical protein
MPALLELFKDEEPHWYAIMCSFEIHLLKLACRCFTRVDQIENNFQYDMIAITTINATINITIISILSRHF